MSDRVKRVASARILHHSMTIMVGVNNALWHLANNPGDGRAGTGLTDKEKAWLDKKRVELESIREEISIKLGKRLQHR